MNQIANWLEQHHVNVVTIVVTAAILIAAGVVIVLVNRLLRRWLGLLEARLRLPYHSIVTLTRVVSGALWVLAILLVLDIWGVGIRGLWTLLVSTATVVGVGFLATWTMISNVTASFFLAVWRPFSLGDTVEMLPENLRGRVIDRNLMFTALREENGSVLQVPNNLFFQKMFRVVDRDDRFLFEELERSPNAAQNRRRAQSPIDSGPKSNA